MTGVLAVVHAIFWGLVVLSFLVMIHEFGHFLVAHAFGVRVTEFFLGLPCRVSFSHVSKRYGTKFGITPLLLGGYNKICGMEYQEDPSLVKVFALVYQRGRVTAKDIAATLELNEDEVYKLCAALCDLGCIEPYYNPALGEKPTQKMWPQAFQTLARDAQFLCAYDAGHDFSSEGSTQAGEPHALPKEVSTVFERELHHTYAGLKPWQRILVLLAGPFINVIFSLLVVLIMLIFAYQVPFAAALSAAFGYLVMVAKITASLLMPSQTLNVLSQSSSVVGISAMASQAAAAGPETFALFAALLSLSLGCMNLLPVPPLDGGKIVIEIIQGIKRSPVSLRTQNIISYVGLAFILFIFIFGLKNDIAALIFH